MSGAAVGKGKGGANSVIGSGREDNRVQEAPGGCLDRTTTASRDRSPDLDSGGLRLARRVVHAETAANRKRLSTSVKLKAVILKTGYRGSEHRVGGGAGQRCLSAGNGERNEHGDHSGKDGENSGDDNPSGDDRVEGGDDECVDEGDDSVEGVAGEYVDGGDESGCGDDGDEHGVGSADSTDDDRSGDRSAGPGDGGAGQSGGIAGRRGNNVSGRTQRGAVGGKRTDLPRITYSTGDGVLRAAVVHAIRALGGFKMVSVTRRATDDGEAEVQRVSGEAPTVFVVARRPRRSVRLLLSLARGSWVVAEAWLLDSIHARAWQPFQLYVPREFSGVLPARAARGKGESLFKGLRFGSRGTLNVDIADLRELVECTGGRLGNNRDASVVIVGREPGGRVPALFAESAVMVNQLWLPDCVAQWKKLPYDSYLVS